MAIISSVPGVKVYVKVGGTRAIEYDHNDGEEGQGLALEDFDVPPGYNQPPPRVIKYIEAKPGAQYSIHFSTKRSFHRRSHHIAAQLTLDGSRCNLRHELMQETARSRGKNATEISSDFDAVQRRRFRFSPLQIVENDQIPRGELAKQIAVAKHAGVIKVALFHMRASLPARAPHVAAGNSGGNDNKENTAPQQIAEKALKGKAVDCKTDYITEPAGAVEWIRSVYNDPLNRPFALFEFRYRSNEGLIKEGIIERPTAVRQEIDSMTGSQVRQRLAELLEQNQGRDEQDRVKPEGEALRGIKREAPAVKQEEWEARYKTRRLDNGRVEVDLTDD